MITSSVLDSPGRQTYIDRAAGARSWSALRRWISSRISAVVSCYGPRRERCGVCETWRRSRRGVAKPGSGDRRPASGQRRRPTSASRAILRRTPAVRLYLAHPDLGSNSCARHCYRCSRGVVPRHADVTFEVVAISTRCGKQDVVSPWTRSNSFVGLGPLQDRTYQMIASTARASRCAWTSSSRGTRQVST